MDAAQLTELFAVGALLVFTIRFTLGMLDRAEAGFASLFVPPDRTMPWPRGVQESDAPWGWRPPLETLEPDARDLDGPAPDLEAAIVTPAAGHSRYVAPPHRVAPVRFRALPQ